VLFDGSFAEPSSFEQPEQLCLLSPFYLVLQLHRALLRDEAVPIRERAREREREREREGVRVREHGRRKVKIGARVTGSEAERERERQGERGERREHQQQTKPTIPFPD